jgi:hypothetical protein
VYTLHTGTKINWNGNLQTILPPSGKRYGKVHTQGGQPTKEKKKTRNELTTITAPNNFVYRKGIIRGKAAMKTE